MEALGPQFYPTVLTEIRRFTPLMDRLYGSSAVGEFPTGFRVDLFDRAVQDLKAERAEHADIHRVACRHLARWLERRGTHSDEELWRGLKDRFLRYGFLTVDGETYSNPSDLPMTQPELDAADDEGRVEAHGNLHWTNLARSVGSERNDLPRIRAAIDHLLDEARPVGERLGDLLDGAAVRGFGIAHPALTIRTRHP